MTRRLITMGFRKVVILVHWRSLKDAERTFTLLNPHSILSADLAQAKLAEFLTTEIGNVGSNSECLLLPLTVLLDLAAGGG